ncbi:Organic hydroperoxide resistance transcriptional regulator [Frondihabitans sp. 762G35]|uniref:MarR family winged helix-turn-helix transcriptional regulator n=1 Tax=Frondihabitans sp. 762G35 TaxID=1446794 RepID=UPI000D2193D1|nr:MarR family transcriptional regulator [Frondihabitans sp. 762G35]ARC57374.1 Organic hydroperoxide resistance transcriptional regulator [Frondihabitans sp. 762G35]
MSDPEFSQPADPMASWPIGRLLSTAARLVEHDWVEALEKLGLTHAGLIALHLLDSGSLSQTELARQARVEAQTMSRTLERLERQGHVTRERSPLDARRHVVARTASGTEAWREAQTLEADLFPALDDPDGLRRALLAIVHAASAPRF